MILVTGGAGYVGSVLVRELLRMGHAVRVVDPLWFGNPFDAADGLEIIKADVQHAAPEWFVGITSVIHLAGLSNDPTADFAPALNAESNVRATRLLAEGVARAANAQGREIRLLFASTCSVYYTAAAGAENVPRMAEDSPTAPTANYSKTKRLAEVELLRVADRHPLFCPVILRKGTLFGLSPRMRFDLVLNTFTLHAWRSRLLTVHGDGEAWRPLLHIADAVDAYIHLLWAPTPLVRGEAFNLVHRNITVLDLAHTVAEVLERERGVDIRVKRDRTSEYVIRSYQVSGDKIANTLGFRAERGPAQAVLGMWDAVERGEFGVEPEKDARYFNIRLLRGMLAAAERAAEQESASREPRRAPLVLQRAGGRTTEAA